MKCNYELPYATDKSTIIQLVSLITYNKTT